MLGFALLLLVFNTGLVTGLHKAHRDVVTTQGLVRGYFDPAPPRYTYLGVPYARPPTKRNRFKNPSTYSDWENEFNIISSNFVLFHAYGLSKPPRPPQRWDGIFEAIYRVKCPQRSGGNENCLVVNVFTPEHGTSLPVLVHVHGGGFESGWGSHKPSLGLIKNDIIIVTFNYRLGALGFLSLGISEASGNAGLKDQVALLYWVQRNIANFGGNPLDVTIYGTESGAASVELLILSNITKGLFQKVILESGSSLSPLTMAYDPFSRGVKSAINLGYKGPEESEYLLSFYKNIPASKLINITEEFLPCVEILSYKSHSILDVDPLEIFKNGNFDKVAMLIVYKDFSINSAIFDKAPDNFDELLPNNLEFDNYKTKHKIAELVKDFYFDSDDNVSQKYDNYIQDITTIYPIVKSAHLHAVKSAQPVYLMKFLKNAADFQNRFENIADFICTSQNVSFNILIAEILNTFWSNFIKYGDPTPLATFKTPIIWEPVIADPGSRTKINLLQELTFGNKPIMSRTPLGQQLIFWDRIYENFYKLHKP